MRAWHFLRADGCLNYPPHTPVVVGETLRHEGPLVLCQSGLHWSRRAIDALRYAPGPIVCRVEVGGELLEEGDKGCSTERTVVWMYDATVVLRRFARLCALDAIHLWDAPEVVVRYLRTGDESLRAAAWDAAAWAAAGDAAWAAAGDAAWDAQNRRLERMLREGRP